MTPKDEADCPHAPTDKGAFKFVWTISELREDLANWSDQWSVIVTLNPVEQGEIWMVFHKIDDGYQD